MGDMTKRVARLVNKKTGYRYPTELEQLNYRRWHNVGGIARCKSLLCHIARTNGFENMALSIQALLDLMTHDVKKAYEIDRQRVMERSKQKS